MGETLIRQAILHGLVAAAFIEAVLVTWRISRAESRLAFWVLALAVPFLLVPTYVLAAPFRLDDHFAARFALFSTARWNALRVGGRGVADLAFAIFALAGGALFLRDLGPFIVQAWRERRRATRSAPTGGEPLEGLVRAQSAALATPPPAIELLQSDAMLLFVRGMRSTTLVASTGVLRRLAPQELKAAVTHELAHVRFRDPLAGWGLMVARLTMFWNPAVQLIARAIVQETEHRADAVAIRAAGVEAFESAFGRLSAPASTDGPDAGLARSLRSLRSRMHHEDVKIRRSAWTCADEGPQQIKGRLVIVGVTLAALLFLVV